jgi:colanic acid/amylovoran biosynthesis glycosyltransferase
MVEKPIVVVYRDHLLASSETFVLRQAEALQRFIPYYVGSRLVRGLPLPLERTLTVNQNGFLGKGSEAIFKLWGLAPALTRRVRDLHPALIHAHFGPDGVTALPLARSLRIPLLVTFHGYDATVRDEYARRSFYNHRLYLRRRETLKHEGNLFIAVSWFIKGRLVEQGFPSDKIVVHYIGVDTEAFQPDPAVRREPIVLFVGRLTEKKGCEHLLWAMSRVQATMPEVQLIVVGDGPLRAELEGQAARFLRRYKFVGIQPPRVVRSWMNRALLLCAPSVTASSGDSEGLPITVIEALAMGLPIVSSVHAGIPEAVIHGVTGFLAAERDSAALASYILQLLKDEMLWQRFSTQSRERARSVFDIHKQARALEDIYEVVLTEGG